MLPFIINIKLNKLGLSCGNPRIHFMFYMIRPNKRIFLISSYSIHIPASSKEVLFHYPFTEVVLKLRLQYRSNSNSILCVIQQVTICVECKGKCKGKVNCKYKAKCNDGGIFKGKGNGKGKSKSNDIGKGKDCELCKIGKTSMYENVFY